MTDRAQSPPQCLNLSKTIKNKPDNENPDCWLAHKEAMPLGSRWGIKRVAETCPIPVLHWNNKASVWSLTFRTKPCSLIKMCKLPGNMQIEPLWNLHKNWRRKSYETFGTYALILMLSPPAGREKALSQSSHCSALLMATRLRDTSVERVSIANINICAANHFYFIFLVQ